MNPVGHDAEAGGTKVSGRTFLKGLAAAVALGAVFAAWLRPDMVLALATQAWSCF